MKTHNLAVTREEFEAIRDLKRTYVIDEQDTVEPYEPRDVLCLQLRGEVSGLPMRDDLLVHCTDVRRVVDELDINDNEGIVRERLDKLVILSVRALEIE